MQQRYREAVGGLTVPTAEANSGTVGTAFDWLVRFLVHPEPRLDLAAIGAANCSPHMLTAFCDLAARLGIRPNDLYPAEAVGGPVTFAGPASASTADEDLLARSCWALALLTEVFRGGLVPGSPLSSINASTVTAEDLLALAPPQALDQLTQLHRGAEARLTPELVIRRGLWAVGPTFDGSLLMNADADLVAGGLLLEVKTTLGAKRKNGSRPAALDGQTVLQLLGYTLLDFSDAYSITDLGVYAARYTHLATWNLQEFLDELADRSVDLIAERAKFHALLRGGRGLDS